MKISPLVPRGSRAGEIYPRVTKKLLFRQIFRALPNIMIENLWRDIFRSTWSLSRLHSLVLILVLRPRINISYLNPSPHRFSFLLGSTHRYLTTPVLTSLLPPGYHIFQSNPIHIPKSSSPMPTPLTRETFISSDYIKFTATQVTMFKHTTSRDRASKKSLYLQVWGKPVPSLIMMAIALVCLQVFTGC